MSREDPDGTIVNNSNWIIGFDLATGKTVRSSNQVVTNCCIPYG